ncbi:hypothetical protein N656DRAFT_778559 [Canariomyces notabilis]|uniref:HD/PDEase domain-containing protein n=1 Tax=Canariomyces notabilis TaxID=2074819 RepID=A0AAN6TEP8_9PEZI|nr:hypothetical protein N656DRAFT_778559 [Canariomyces arenarius]
MSQLKSILLQLTAALSLDTIPQAKQLEATLTMSDSTGSLAPKSNWNSINPKPEPGYFQTIQYPSADHLIIHDTLYGTHTITEPVLVSLLQSPSLLRLSSVCQHGITGLLGFTPRVTRLEHSIGAFLLVRKVNATLSEQVAALLHDISHTALSHVVDWAGLSTPGSGSGESFHEVHKTRFVESTDLPSIIARHGFGPEVFNEGSFPLVESPAPHLCADRLDYALRDAVGFGKLDLQDARRVYTSVMAYPDATTSPHRMLVLTDRDLAMTLARAYLAVDRDVWSNPAHISVYQRAGRVIGDAIRSGVVRESDLWGLSDREFWKVLREATDEVGKESMRRLEVEGLPEDENLGLPVGTKVRTLDPDVLGGGGGDDDDDAEAGGPGGGLTCQALSVWCPAWAEERTAYILARKRLQGIESS